MSAPNVQSVRHVLPRGEHGFTLVELMVTLSILVVAIAIGVPSFSQAFISNRLASFSNSFVANLALARSEAVKRNANVVVCRTTDGLSCTSSGGWQLGWMAFADNGLTSGNANNQVLDSDERRILYQPELTSGYTLVPTNSITNITFNGSGMLAASSSGAEIVFELKKADTTSQHREIRLGVTGRSKIRKCPENCS